MSVKTIVEKARKIKVVVTDVDGVLTDGFVFIRDNQEEPFGKFSILDGFAIPMSQQCGLKTVAMSGRKSLATEARCYKLGMDLVYSGVADKRSKLYEIAAELKVELDEMAYIGDDLIDLPALIRVGLSCAPANAVAEVKNRVDFVSAISGGNGVFREVVELILKAQGSYSQFLAKYLS